MTQQSDTDFPMDAETMDGTEQARRITELNYAFNSSNSGASRPVYAVEGTPWLKNDVVDSRPYYLFNGTVDVLIATLDNAGGITFPLESRFANYLTLTGGVLSGNLTISNPAPKVIINTNGPSEIAAVQLTDNNGFVRGEMAFDTATNMLEISRRDSIGNKLTSFEFKNHDGVDQVVIDSNFTFDNGTADSPKVRFDDKFSNPGETNFGLLSLWEGKFRFVTNYNNTGIRTPFWIEISDQFAHFTYNPYIEAPTATPDADQLVHRGYVDSAITDAAIGESLTLTNYGEGSQNLGGGISGSLTINSSGGNVATGTFTGATDITLSTTHTNTSISVLMTNAGTFLNWVTPILWEGGTEPVWSTSGQDLLTLTKIGSVWIGGALIGVA